MLAWIVAAALAVADGGVGEPQLDVDAGAPPPAAAPADVPPAEPAVSAEVERTAPSQFVKGELSMYLGSDRLTVKNTRIGVSAGIDRFGPAFYLLVEPMVDLRFLDGALGIGVGVPLRLELVNFSTDPSTGAPYLAKNIGRIRREDWLTYHDAGRVLKYVTYGRKEDRLYISAGQRYSSSIGHGTLVRRYAPNVDIDYPRASAQVDMYNDYAGFEFMTNDLLEWNQLAAIAFIKPLSFFKPENLLAKSLSVGVSGALDWKAPWELERDATTGIRQTDIYGRLRSTARGAKLFGIDAEVKVVKTEHVDIKPYVDYSMLIDGDGGFTAGALGRFNVGKDTVNAFRVVAELRFLGNRYAPSYFDTFYEIDRFTYLAKDFRTPGDVFANFIPKQRYVTENGLGQRFGYYLEGSWGIRNVVGLTLAIEGVSNSKATNFVAHLEVPVLSFLQVFGSYYLRGIESWTELGYDDSKGVLGLFGDKAIAFAGARVKVLPFLFLNGRAYKTFRMNPNLQRYDNQFGFVVDLEIGYEFQKKNVPPPPADTVTAPSAPPPPETTPASEPAPTPQ